MGRKLFVTALAAVLCATVVATSAQAAPTGGSSPIMPPGVAGTADPHGSSTDVIGDCQPTYFCVWQDINYSGGPGRFAGNNPDWRRYLHSGCQTGTWDDCASSGYNNGTSGLGVAVFSDTNYSGLGACLPRGWQNGDFTGLVWPNSNVSFNDSISSNRWTSSC